MADQPYTEADVERLAPLIAAEHGSEVFEPTHVPYEFTDAEREQYRAEVTAILDALAAAGRLLPEGARAHGICGEHAPVLFGAGLDLQVCELTAGHKGWHGRPNGPGEPWMNWTGGMIVSGSTDE